MKRLRLLAAAGAVAAIRRFLLCVVLLERLRGFPRELEKTDPNRRNGRSPFVVLFVPCFLRGRLFACFPQCSTPLSAGAFWHNCSIIELIMLRTRYVYT